MVGIQYVLLCVRVLGAQEGLVWCVNDKLSTQVLPHEVLVTESGELSELGKTYIPPRVLHEALCVISSVAGLDVDSFEPEKLALEMLLVSHHPSVGKWRDKTTLMANVWEFYFTFLFHCISSLLHIYCDHLFFLLVAVQPGLWPTLLIKMKIDPKDFITKHLNDILPRITAYTRENQVMDFCFPCVSFRRYFGTGEFSGEVKY